MISFVESPESIQVEQLSRGFFEYWPNPPSPETHLTLLRESDAVVLALDESSRTVVGFITAISDGVLAAYIPLLEVVPEYRDRGIGKELVRRMLERLDDLYMVDLLCHPSLQGFYQSLGMEPAVGMIRRRYDRQDGMAPRVKDSGT